MVETGSQMPDMEPISESDGMSTKDMKLGKDKDQRPNIHCKTKSLPIPLTKESLYKP